MPDIFALADRFRAVLLRRDRATARLLVEAYADVWRRIKRDLDRLAKDADEAEKRGEPVTRAWLMRQGRLLTLERHVERQIAAVARIAGGAISADQLEAVRSAQEHARDLVAAALPERAGVVAAFNRLPSSAVEQIVAVLATESPLTDLLAELGPEAARNVRRSLLAGVALGRHPRTIAREVKNDVGGSLVRALTIARTETLRAYRSVSLATYQANDDVVKGWRWNARLDRRTCAFCWSMHGTVHPLSERFASHPNCRCAPVPVTRSFRELGLDVEDSAPEPGPTGVEAFGKLAASEQRQILGPAKFAAFRAGKIDLADVRGFRRDRKWGPVGYERSLREIVGEKEAARWSKAA